MGISMGQCALCKDALLVLDNNIFTKAAT